MRKRHPVLNAERDTQEVSNAREHSVNGGKAPAPQT